MGTRRSYTCHNSVHHTQLHWAPHILPLRASHVRLPELTKDVRRTAGTPRTPERQTCCIQRYVTVALPPACCRRRTSARGHETPPARKTCVHYQHSPTGSVTAKHGGKYNIARPDDVWNPSRASGDGVIAICAVCSETKGKPSVKPTSRGVAFSDAFPWHARHVWQRR